MWRQPRVRSVSPHGWLSVSTTYGLPYQHSSHKIKWYLFYRFCFVFSPWVFVRFTIFFQIQPDYQEIGSEKIPVVNEESFVVRILAGNSHGKHAAGKLDSHLMVFFVSFLSFLLMYRMLYFQYTPERQHSTYM